MILYSILSTDDDTALPKNSKMPSVRKMLSSDGDEQPLQKKARSSPGSDEITAKNTQKETNPSTPTASTAKKVTRSSAKTRESRIETEVSTKVKNEEDYDPYFVKEKEELVQDFEGLSDYERMIQKNIAEKQKLFDSLEISKVKDELFAMKPQPVKKTSYRGIAKEKKSPSEPVIIRRSLRQQKLTPDGLDLPLPSEKEIAKASFVVVRDRSRPPPGPAALMDYYNSENRTECETFFKELQTLPLSREEKSVWCDSITSVLQKMKKMKISEDLVAKVVPQRTCAVQIHPTLDKILVLVGSVLGNLGIWDVERKDETSGAYYFNPHSAPINCLTIDKWNPQYVFSTSYDGSLRRTDLIAGIVQQVHGFIDEDYYSMYTWHTHMDENNILVSASHGKVIHVDVRAGEKKPAVYQVEEKKNVKVVTAHPTQTHYFATASTGGIVCLWDARKFKKNKPIAALPHTRNVCGLEFSPVTGNSLISTCMDNNLRFISCDLVDLKVQRKIYHCTQTGRWLTTLKARYVPHREDLIVVGSLMRPRRIQVWRCDGQLHHEFMGDCFASVSSITALHPTRPILAGTNSSGRAHIFK